MCDLWHPIWSTIAEDAGVRPIVVAGVRLALERDAHIIAASPAIKARLIARGYRCSLAGVERVLATLTTHGLLADGKLTARLPDPTPEQVHDLGYSQNPEAIKKRRQRARKAARGHVPSTRDNVPIMSPATGTWVGQLSLPVVPPTSFTSVQDQLDDLNRAHDAVGQLPGDMSPPYVYVTKEHKKKKDALRQEEPISRVSAPLAPSAPRFEDLNQKGLTNWRWVQGLKRYSMDVLPPKEWAALIDALPDALVLTYAAGRHLLPAKPYKTLCWLSDHRKARKGKTPEQIAQFEQDERKQREMMLLIDGGAKTSEPADEDEDIEAAVMKTAREVPIPRLNRIVG
jgi:hypothetical protein